MNVKRYSDGEEPAPRLGAVLFGIGLIALIIVFLGFFWSASADDAKKIDPKAAPATITIPEIDVLRWSNLRLDAQARQARSESLRFEAAALNEEADKFLTAKKRELCKAAGVDPDLYDLSPKKDGGIDLILKKPPEAPKP